MKMASSPYESCHDNAYLLKFELKALVEECDVLKKELSSLKEKLGGSLLGKKEKTDEKVLIETFTQTDKVTNEVNDGVVASGGGLNYHVVRSLKGVQSQHDYEDAIIQCIKAGEKEEKEKDVEIEEGDNGKDYKFCRNNLFKQKEHYGILEGNATYPGVDCSELAGGIMETSVLSDNVTYTTPTNPISTSINTLSTTINPNKTQNDKNKKKKNSFQNNFKNNNNINNHNNFKNNKIKNDLNKNNKSLQLSSFSLPLLPRSTHLFHCHASTHDLHTTMQTVRAAAIPLSNTQLTTGNCNSINCDTGKYNNIQADEENSANNKHTKINVNSVNNKLKNSSTNATKNMSSSTTTANMCSNYASIRQPINKNDNSIQLTNNNIKHSNKGRNSKQYNINYNTENKNKQYNRNDDNKNYYKRNNEDDNNNNYYKQNNEDDNNNYYKQTNSNNLFDGQLQLLDDASSAVFDNYHK